MKGHDVTGSVKKQGKKNEPIFEIVSPRTCLEQERGN